MFIYKMEHGLRCVEKHAIYHDVFIVIIIVIWDVAIFFSFHKKNISNRSNNSDIHVKNQVK